jgi:pimeloyl-ACP methyl ester carboxylesterase
VLERQPERFDKLIFLLPAGLDVEFQYKERMLRTVALVEGKTKEKAIEALLGDPERQANYIDYPFLRDLDRQMLQQFNPVGAPRAIREIIEDWPVSDREVLRRVTAPTLLICQEGDDIHPAELGRILVEIMPNAELLMFEDGRAMYEAIPEIVLRVREFILS